MGDTGQNYRKKTYCRRDIEDHTSGKISYVDNAEDPRDYRVDFSRIKNELGFAITKTLPDGIREIASAIEKWNIKDPYDPNYIKI